MGDIKSFYDLEVWNKSHQFTLKLYSVIKSFPNEERYILESQIKRAAISISTNIAEGMGRYSQKEFLQHLVISRGSTEECKYLVLLSKDLNYVNQETYENLNELLNEIGKMLNGLIRSLKAKL
jgi:four helix bundle protein